MAWSSVGWPRGAGLLVIASCLAGSARAESESAAPPPSWLDWHGPLECRNTREVERELASLLGREPDPASLPPTRVDLGWSTERGWTLRIGVLLPGGERRREVDVHTCIDGFDVVALTLALILDPSLRDPSAAAAATDGTNPAPEAASPDAAEPRTGDAPPAPAAGVTAADPAPAGERAEPRSPEGRGPPPFALAVSASGRADLGTLPTSLYGGGLELGLSAGSWRLDSGAALLTRSNGALPSARYAVSYSNLFAVVRGCRQFEGERGGYFGTCAGGQLGSLAASEQGGDRHAARGLWAAATAGAELGLALSSHWSAFSRLELAFPLIQHQFILAGGVVAYELPAVTVQLTLGAAITLTDWGEP